jgi:hypothetical protein
VICAGRRRNHDRRGSDDSSDATTTASDEAEWIAKATPSADGCPADQPGSISGSGIETDRGRDPAVHRQQPDPNVQSQVGRSGARRFLGRGGLVNKILDTVHRHRQASPIERGPDKSLPMGTHWPSHYGLKVCGRGGLMAAIDRISITAIETDGLARPPRPTGIDCIWTELSGSVKRPGWPPDRR